MPKSLPQRPKTLDEAVAKFDSRTMATATRVVATSGHIVRTNSFVVNSISKNDLDARHDHWVLDQLYEHLGPALGSIGAQVFIDRKSLKGGEKWRDKIFSAAEKTCCVILVLNPEFFGSGYIQNVELPYFLGQARDQKVRIFPLYSRDCIVEQNEEVDSLHFFGGRRQPLNIDERGLPDARKRIFELSRAVFKEIQVATHCN